MNGGFLVTLGAMIVTYGSGRLAELSGWLGTAWSNITPGQAALLIGLLTFVTHNGKGPARALSLWLAARARAYSVRRRARGGRDMRALGWLTAATVAAFVVLVLLARAAFGG